MIAACRYVEGLDRRQALCLPDVLDDYVGEDDEVRFIDAFVDTLDLTGLGFTHSEPSDEEDEGGRSPYDPRDMLKLYVWGYLNQVRSSRKLERECHRNLELIWLMKKLAPDFKTIADFRKDNVHRVKSVFKEFVAFLQDIDLVEGKLASIDGSKIKACNSRKRNFNAEFLASKLRRIEERVERYLKELEHNDGLGDGEEDGDGDGELISKRNDYLRAKLEKLKKSKEELEEVRKKLEESGKSEISLTDPESREMKNNGRIDVCYNAELSVDSKEHIIVNYDVTNEANDTNQLAPMATSTKEVLGVEKLDVTADTGFANMAQIKDCLDNGITPYLPSTKLDGSGGSRVPDPSSFGKDRFVYERDRDAYICPAENELTFRHTTQRKGKAVRIYRTDACATCPFRARCTNNKEGRTIERWEHQDIIDEVVRRARREPEKLEARGELAEHPFGTIKRAFNQGYFLLKGLRKVKGEMGFTVLAYDMRRALNILGTRGLLNALAGLIGGGGAVIDAK
jgi:transposase